MRLAFVYPPFFAHVFNENLPTVDDEFGLFPHIGFGWAARGAAAVGWEVKLFDCAARKLTVDQVIRELEIWGPDLVGFAAHACQTFRDMLGFAEEIKKRTGLPALVGGYEAKAYPVEIMGHACFDFLCAGESMSFLPEFLPAFERGSGYERVPDLVWRDGGRLRRTFPGPTIPFSEFPTPDRSVFDNRLYYSHISQRRSFTIGMSEVGCPYPCTFCCMRKSGYDARSTEQILDEMEECSALGIREIDWFDPLMLHDRQRAIDISREVARRELDIIWSCRSRVDSLSFHRPGGKVDEELIEALAAGGCRRIYFGVESGDDDVLAAMSKAQSATADQRKVLHAVADAGIMALGFFILGAPGDDEITIQRTIDYSLSLPLAYAQYQIAIIKPHTELERKHLIEELGYDYWREYMAGNVDDVMLPTPWTQLTRPELEAAARKAYLRFYSRPRYALGMLGRIESIEELVRYARVGTQMVLRPLRPATGATLETGRRLGRAAFTFAEAALTVANPGARHPVFAAGGGLRGAVQLAREEFRKDEPDPKLDEELIRELVVPPSEDEASRPEPELPELIPQVAAARYEPVFPGLPAGG